MEGFEQLSQKNQHMPDFEYYHQFNIIFYLTINIFNV